MRLPVLDIPLVPTAPSRAFDTGPRSIAAVRMLRVSVTDRCNYRCLYCMPEEGVRWLPKEEILSFEEIAGVVRAAVEVHGVRRFKLTGGEPTVRHGLLDLVALLARIPGVEDLSLTTNGQRLSDLARPLREAGLHRVTVSLDSLDAEKFRRITRTGDLAAVLAGIDRAEEAGFTSVKVNCVTMRGANDDELTSFARLTLHRRLTVRFIEYMPLGDAALLHAHAAGLRADPAALYADSAAPHADPAALFATPRVDAQEQGPAGGCGAQDRGEDVLIPEAEARAAIERDLGPLVPIDPRDEAGVGPAKVYRLARGNPRGRVGFISAMSAPFCSTCNRLRLTANGLLRSCLFEGGEVDLKPILRPQTPAGIAASRAALGQAMTDCVRLKPDVHSRRGGQQMSRIGG